jgi:hypothetical protein
MYSWSKEGFLMLVGIFVALTKRGDGNWVHGYGFSFGGMGSWERGEGDFRVFIFFSERGERKGKEDYDRVCKGARRGTVRMYYETKIVLESNEANLDIKALRFLFPIHMQLYIIIIKM